MGREWDSGSRIWENLEVAGRKLTISWMASAMQSMAVGARSFVVRGHEVRPQVGEHLLAAEVS